MAEPTALTRLTVAGKRRLTPDIWEFTLEPADRAALQPFEPGAHIGIETPSGAMRQYSLVNDGRAPERYVIALKREPDSRGGSRSMVEDAAVGGTLRADAPANSFALAEAPGYLLIAGGIGIAPILAMANRLDAERRPFRLIYCTRSAGESAYLDEMQDRFGSRLIVHHDGGEPDAFYDFWDAFAEPADIRVYCCGPKALMEEVRAVSGHWPEGRVQFEDFKPVEAVRPDDRPFEVVLRRSGRTVAVPADLPILEALRGAGIRVPSSCESGVCGTCKTRLLAGEADHRDKVLMPEERADFIMLCVSRAQGGVLTLDL
ncbi:MAG: oxidoreductase [Rhodospirillaceae bacterium]|nr:oxidoreductase [Rhodospirillaceae bacterium]MYB15326.1 oxidoreductase [Rhodospirillaceae bacterium]MYI50686.1 oxidoreductase [Rhodospirillaceae bacterium]